MSILMSNRLSKVTLSPTLAISAKAIQMRQAGIDVISLSAGEPDFDTPDHIKYAAVLAIQEGFTKYTAVEGIIELRKAIVQKFKRENNLTYNTDEIIVSTGAKQGIYNLCQALLNHNDEVIIPAPYWVSYPDMVLLADAKPKIIETNFAQNYKITPTQLKNTINKNTKMLILNSPSNPTGVVYSAEELKALAEVLLEHPQVLILTDDIYEHIIWDTKFVNILNVAPELQDRTVIFNGVSKSYAMTGWRIGYAAGPKDIIKAMTIIQSQSTSNPCSIAQKAAVEALNGDNLDIKKMCKSFEERHNYVFNRLNNIKNVKVFKAHGAFYIFPDISAVIKAHNFDNDLEFAAKLLEEQALALVPGSAFGCEGAIRLSFATSLENLEKGLDRFDKFCSAI